MQINLNMVVTKSSELNSISLSGDIGLIGPIGCINLVIVISPQKSGEAVFLLRPFNLFNLRS